MEMNFIYCPFCGQKRSLLREGQFGQVLTGRDNHLEVYYDFQPHIGCERAYAYRIQWLLGDVPARRSV